MGNCLFQKQNMNEMKTILLFFLIVSPLLVNVGYASNTDVTAKVIVVKTEEPTDPSLYSPTATYNFNITWPSSMALNEVILEMDGVNYSYPGQLTKVDNTYNKTFPACIDSGTGGGGGGGGRLLMCYFDPFIIIEIYKLLTIKIVRAAEPCLGIGIHNYKWFAKDNNNNWYYTNLYTFKIFRTDPVYIDIISPENKTYSSNSVDIKYSVSSPFDISWIGYSLDNKPNVTLTGNTSINVVESSHNIIFYANTTYGIMNNSQVYFTVSLPTTTTTIKTTTTIPSCTCTAWQLTFDCCYFRYSSKGHWVRTCNPRGCQAESKCEGFCMV